MINEKRAIEKIKYAYQQIRIVKEIIRGNRSPVAIAKKTGAPLNLIHYHLNDLTH